MRFFQEIRSECYSYSNNVWTQIQSLAIPRHESGITSLPQSIATSKNDIFVVGGDNTAPGFLLSSESYTSAGEFVWEKPNRWMKNIRDIHNEVITPKKSL